MLSDFFVADQSLTAALQRGEPAVSPALSTSGVDNGIVADLWAALDPQADISPLVGDGCLLAMQGGHEWLFKLPDALVDGLVALSDASADEVCERWAAGEETQHAEVSADDLHGPLRSMKALAVTAKAKNLALLLRVTI